MERINWLLDPDYKDELLLENETYAIPMPQEIGTGIMHTLALPLGMNLSIINYRFTDNIAGQWLETANMQAKYDEPHLAIQSILVGKGLMQDHLTNKTYHYGAGEVLVGFANQVDARFKAEAASRLEGVVLEIDLNRLHRLIGEALSVKLLQNMKLTEGSLRSVSHPLIEKHLRQCASTTLTGPLRKLFVQSQVLNLLVELTGAAQMNVSFESKKSNLIRELREEIDMSPKTPPNLDELARRYGMSSRTINEGFKQLFGSTLVAYCAQKRLDAAHTALCESDTAIKVLAAKLGYSHVNNFTAAFSRQFGVTPGSLRKRNTGKV